MSDKGKCKHGEFVLTEGCPQCIAERQVSELAEQVKLKMAAEDGQEPPGLTPALVKVQYYSETTGELSAREYTYYSIDLLAVGDIVIVPVRDSQTKAKVSAIDVPEAEIFAFKDKVKTIPAGSVKTMPASTTGINLCDTCSKRNDYPICTDSDAAFGDGKGNDNIIQCGNYDVGEAKPCTIPLNVLIVPEPETTAARVIQPETAIALRPGEDIEAHDYYKEGLRLLEYAERRVIATVEDTKLATDDLSLISKLKKDMEAKKREYLDPLRDQAEAIRETYSALMDPILAAEKLTKTKMLDYSVRQEVIRKLQEEINRKRMEAAQEEMKLTGELSESVNLVEVQPEVSTRVSTEMGSTGQRDNWKYEVVDVDALPREYMIPDLVMLNAIAKKYHDQKKIAGVRFYCEKIIATRVR